MSDGTLYTYLDGTEYSDIAGAWDWNHIPGITTNYAATKLSCSHTQFSSDQAFVGGASDGKIGAAAMRYKNPATDSLSFQKAWFFLDNDIQHIMIADVSSASGVSSLSMELTCRELSWRRTSTWAGIQSLWACRCRLHIRRRRPHVLVTTRQACNRKLVDHRNIYLASQNR